MTSKVKGLVHGPLCPECESTQTRCRATGYGHDDERLRQRRCDDCGCRFVTVEVAFTGTSWGSLIPGYREKDRGRRRYTRFGWDDRPDKYHDIAYLDVEVKVRTRPPRRKAA